MIGGIYRVTADEVKAKLGPNWQSGFRARMYQMQVSNDSLTLAISG